MHVCAFVSFSQKLSTLASKQLFFYPVGAQLHPVAEGIQSRSNCVDVLDKKTVLHLLKETR